LYRTSGAAFAAFSAPFTGKEGRLQAAARNLRVKDAVMSARIVMQVNAVIGLASAAAASAMIWLVWTRPIEVAASIADREYGAVAVAVASQLGAWLHALLRFL
jgi:hypothetical protein